MARHRLRSPVSFKPKLPLAVLTALVIATIGAGVVVAYTGRLG
ncbi:MAG TPA: hypothetical protein VJT49_02485 [Amycolatopsis sp.]|nr:hypothetical protein [Amycolatopsis sp.]HKS43980.1 hypothetical protein [Amycolatopsis sp.]